MTAVGPPSRPPLLPSDDGARLPTEPPQHSEATPGDRPSEQALAERHEALAQFIRALRKLGGRAPPPPKT